jgi:hypothetical protein
MREAAGASERVVRGQDRANEMNSPLRRNNHTKSTCVDWTVWSRRWLPARRRLRAAGAVKPCSARDAHQNGIEFSPTQFVGEGRGGGRRPRAPRPLEAQFIPDPVRPTPPPYNGTVALRWAREPMLAPSAAATICSRSRPA